jgi:antitoxin component YwqK of YwqJK toxin-antitoxin module
VQTRAQSRQQYVDADELELDFGDGETYHWQGKPFTGMAYWLYPDGSPSDEEEYVEGRKHNIARSWYSGGQLKSETTYYKGTGYGPHREWDETGQLRLESIREYGYRVREKAWDETGRLLRDEKLEPDRKMGMDAANYALFQKKRTVYDKYVDADHRAWLKALIEQN